MVLAFAGFPWGALGLIVRFSWCSLILGQVVQVLLDLPVCIAYNAFGE